MSVETGPIKIVLPKWWRNRNYPFPTFDRHPIDEFTVGRDYSQPTPEKDKDPRMAEDALDPEAPQGMGGSDTK